MDTDPASSEHAAELTRAEGLWFEDCGLIIQAENTLFRVSRDVLAIHSPVFRDMLALPPPTAADMMEGCPFVRLPDSAVDVAVFLKTLFYFNFFEAHPSPTTFSIVSGVLRMSHKYEVDALRKRALTHISFFHPTKLGKYEDLPDHGFSSFGKIFRDDLLGLIVLARQLSIDWILPIAFYRLIQYSYYRIIDGCKGAELAKEDKTRCMMAIRHFPAAISEVLDFLWTPLEIDGCQSKTTCTSCRIISRRRAEEWRDVDVDVTLFMPLRFWDDDDWDDLEECCDVCLSTMKRTHRQAKQAFWQRLPELFGLPAWTALEEMKAEAFK